MSQILLPEGYKIFIPSLIKSQYKFVKILGKGSFSVVILVQDIQSQKLLAIKIISQKYLIDFKIVSQFENEIKICFRLKHSNIVQVYEMYNDETQIYVLMEYCSNGNLSEYMNSFPLSDNQIKFFFSQILSALCYIHGCGIAHRDLKLQNILLDENLNIKIGDFGFACNNNENLTDSVGSPIYIAPEILSKKAYDGIKADTWSLGVILYILLTRKIPWTATTESQLFYQIQTCSYSIPNNIDEFGRNLISSLMEPVPNIRLSAKECLSHPWFGSNANMIPFSNSNIKSTSSFKSVLRGKMGVIHKKKIVNNASNLSKVLTYDNTHDDL